jgi:hypothetical protein
VKLTLETEDARHWEEEEIATTKLMESFALADKAMKASLCDNTARDILAEDRNRYYSK